MFPHDSEIALLIMEMTGVDLARRNNEEKKRRLVQCLEGKKTAPGMGKMSMKMLHVPGVFCGPSDARRVG